MCVSVCVCVCLCVSVCARAQRTFLLLKFQYFIITFSYLLTLLTYHDPRAETEREGERCPPT